MPQQRLLFIFMICTSLVLIVRMYSINTNPDEVRRYQRGFGNRRAALGTYLRHHYPKDIVFAFDNQDDKYLFSNPYRTIEEKDITDRQKQQQKRSPIIYR